MCNLQLCNLQPCNFQHVQSAICAYFNICRSQHIKIASRAKKNNNNMIYFQVKRQALIGQTQCLMFPGQYAPIIHLHVQIATPANCNTCNLQHMQFLTHAVSNLCNTQRMQLATCAICNMNNLQHVQLATHAMLNMCNLQHMQRATRVILTPANCNMCNLQHMQFATSLQHVQRTSWKDKLDVPAGQTRWTDQFSLLEALASSHIQRLTFQFVHCRSFRVQRRPFFYWTTTEVKEKSKSLMACFLLKKNSNRKKKLIRAL